MRWTLIPVTIFLFGAGAVARAPDHGCGAEPKAPVVSSASVAQYNASVDAVQSYEAAARSYNQCANQHAQAEETAISDAARARIAAVHANTAAVQQRIAGNFNSLTAQLKQAARKLGGH